MAVLTIKHYSDIIDSFVQNVSNSSKTYYVFIGKTSAWPDDMNPPAANTSISEYQQSIYDDIAYGKLIKPSDVAYMIDNNYWTTGTVYDCYDQTDPDLYSKKFYVVTDRRMVYKCVYNGGGAPSTVKPDLAAVSGNFSTSDGYIWKYMYTIDSTYDLKFSSNTYIPITVNTQVSSAAVNGTLDYVVVTNGGSNYQTYTSGFLSRYVNNYVVQLPSTASAYSGFYSGSAIYLKTGFGAGQLRNITAYDGLSRQCYVDSPFITYAHLDLSSINGINNIALGQTVTQRSDVVFYSYSQGYVNVGDVVVQSDTGAYGTVVTSNSTGFSVDKTSTADFSLTLPIIVSSQTGTLKNGTVTVAANSSTVSAVSGTAFANDYSIGSYIRVGSSANNGVRRVTAVNSTVITVDYPFSTAATANVHYSMPYAVTPSSISVMNSNGIIADVNLTGVTLNISNSAVSGLNFIAGETAALVDANNVSQAANGTVAFANTTTVILSNVNGTFSSNLYLVGSSSLQKSKITYVLTSPNVTLSNPSGTMMVGRSVYFRPSSNVQQSVANATLQSFYFTPNELTEFIVSPSVTLTGDGQGAMAYSVINATSNSVSGVVVINSGHDYNSANVTISANTLYGNGAVARAVVSPITGHGRYPTEELGARHVGISVAFGNTSSENFSFPTSGSYRRIGILENPLFSDVIIDVNNFDRAGIVLRNKNGQNFANGEIVVQPSSNAAGVVSSYDPTANSTYLELKNVRGTFLSNTSGDLVYGLSSNASANAATAGLLTFSLGSNVTIVSETLSGATAQVTQIISNTQLRLTNVSGRFDVSDTVTSGSVVANVTAIYVANGQQVATSTFGQRFNQTARITMTTSSGTFSNGEVVTQTVSGAQGVVLSSSDVDLSLSSSSGTFTVGDVVSDQTTGASGLVLYSNTSYLKLTNVTGTFLTNDTINNGSVSANVGNTYAAVVLTAVRGDYKFQTGPYTIVGANSSATGVSMTANTITYPDLVEESGSVTYLENLKPFTKTVGSKENINLVIKF